VFAVLSRSRRARGYQRVFAALSPRVVGGRPIPPELTLLLPDEQPITYVTCRERLHDLVASTFDVEPAAAHAAYTFDVLGGLHDIRVHAAADSLEAVVDAHCDVLREFPLPTCLAVAEQVASPSAIGPARWESLRRRCDLPVTLVDALRVAPASRVVWSAAAQYGPDAFAADPTGDLTLEVQARRIRAAVGLPPRGDACDAAF